MPIHNSIVQVIGDTPIVRLSRLFPNVDTEAYVKLEGANPFGSAKDRFAKYYIEESLRSGNLRAGGHLVESSSGNLGIALAILAPLYGLDFTCVVDPTISRLNYEILVSTGANIDVVTNLADNGSYLPSRINRVQELLELIPGSIWVNQYSNPMAWKAHFNTTADEILQDFERPLDAIVVGVSTVATVFGIAERIRSVWRETKIVAVDAVGSVALGGLEGKRVLPGLGAGRSSSFARHSDMDEVLFIGEQSAIGGCRSLLRCEGIMAGGSSGAVIAAMQQLNSDSPQIRMLGILADRGERYTDSVYRCSSLPAENGDRREPDCVP